MKIGLVCPYAWDVPGGVQAHVHDLAMTLISRGHDISVLAPVDNEDTIVEDFVVDAGRPIALPYNGSVAKLNIGPKATARVRRWIREGDFDVLHVHEPISPSVGLLACWAAQGPIVATWHSSVDRSRLLAASRYIAHTAMEKVTARIAVSEYARRTLVDHLGGDAVLIPNGVCVADFADEQRLPGFGERPTIAFLGRMDETRKGLSVLLDAFALIVEAFPDAELLIAGPGDIEQVEADLDDKIRSNVTLLGKVSQSDKVALLHTADIYVAPNIGGESFGIILLEAMASSTPVVASDLDAFARVLDDGRCGRLFATGDPQALAQAVVDVLSQPELAAHLAQAGYQRSLVYDWESVADDIESVYESVTVNGEKVREDLRGQIVGRFATLSRSR